MTELDKRQLVDWNLRMEAAALIPLWQSGHAPGFDETSGQREPSIVAFLPETRDHLAGRAPGAILVCVGGGFSTKAPHEGWPVCEWLNLNGIAAFLLDYRIAPCRLPTIVAEARRAMRLIRYHSRQWGINSEKIGVLGFSAGGQIAIVLSNTFDYGDLHACDPIERVSSRPDAQVLGYPAVSIISRDDRPEGWHNWVNGLLGFRADAAMARAFSGECIVRRDSPTAFLWGTCDDYLYKYWPPYLAALKAVGVPFESHFFSSGPHGLGLAPEHPTAKAWPSLAVAWLKTLGY